MSRAGKPTPKPNAFREINVQRDCSHASFYKYFFVNYYLRILQFARSQIGRHTLEGTRHFPRSAHLWRTQGRQAPSGEEEEGEGQREREQSQSQSQCLAAVRLWQCQCQCLCPDDPWPRVWAADHRDRGRVPRSRRVGEQARQAGSRAGRW